MDDDLAQLLDKISQQTGMSVNALIKLAVLEFVQSYDLDFDGTHNAVLHQIEEGA
jgi:hypothetical protein